MGYLGSRYVFVNKSHTNKTNNIPGPSSLGGKWFLKGFNSPSLKDGHTSFKVGICVLKIHENICGTSL